MSDSDKKKLCDLKVVDLRSELEKRGLERTGVKQVLSDRLSKALVDEGKDPETYLFDSNETDGKDSGDKPVDKEAEGKEPEKIEEDGAEQNNAEEANDGNDKLDGHESPIRLTLEDDEAIQDVDNDKAGEKDASNDTKKDDAATQDETKAKSVGKGEKDTGDGTSRVPRKRASGAARKRRRKAKAAEEARAAEEALAAEKAPAAEEARASTVQTATAAAVFPPPPTAPSEGPISSTQGDQGTRLPPTPRGQGLPKWRSLPAPRIKEGPAFPLLAANCCWTLKKRMCGAERKRRKKARAAEVAWTSTVRTATAAAASLPPSTPPFRWSTSFTQGNQGTRLLPTPKGQGLPKWRSLPAPRIKTGTASPLLAANFRYCAKTGDNKLQKKVAKSNPNVLWISNVAQNTRASELKAALTACGKVLGAKVVVNAKFPGSCCFGYVTMGSVEDVDNVILKLNNTELNGQIIKIDKFDLVRAEQMKNIGGGKEGDNKSDGKDAEKSNGEKGKGEHRSRSRQTSSSRKDSRTKSVSSRGEGRKGSKERRSRSRGRREQDLLTFEKIKAEREQQRIREKRRQIREEARHLREEDIRRKEAQRRQRIERERLEREKEKLRMEREKIERERAELVRMERERQRLEREKIAMEKMELERTLLRLGEERKAVKRPAQYSRDDGYDNRKRSATDRHFAPPPPPSSSKRDSHYPDKRGADYQSARPSITSRPGSGVIGGSRVYDGRDSRGTRPDIAPMSRSKDARYEREDRSTHYRSSAREERRPIPETKSNIPITERLGRYENSDQSARFDRNVNLWQPPSSKPSFQSGGGGMGQKSWQKDQWRQEPAMTDRWQSSQVAPGRVFGGVSNSSGSICPPPPGMTSYPDNRFNTSMRKY